MKLKLQLQRSTPLTPLISMTRTPWDTPILTIATLYAPSMHPNPNFVDCKPMHLDAYAPQLLQLQT